MSLESKIKDTVNRSVRSFGREDGFGCYSFAVFGKGFARVLIHKRTLEYIFLAGDEVAVGYGVGQREHFGCTDFLVAVNRSVGLDFGNAVVYNGDTDGLSVLTDADRIDFLIGEVSVRRLQFLNEPIAVRDVFKGEYAVLAGFDCKDSAFGSKLGFAAAEESELAPAITASVSRSILRP